MCGHGTIGIIASLAHRGELAPGRVRIDTPCGAVDAELQADGSVSPTTSPATAQRLACLLDVPGVGQVSGDVAWGGNWFFLVREPGLDIGLRNLEALTEFAWRCRQRHTRGHPAVDHVELFGQPADSRAHSRNFSAVPRQGLRPLALRHGHRVQTGLVSRPMTPLRKARSGCRRASSVARSRPGTGGSTAVQGGSVRHRGRPGPRWERTGHAAAGSSDPFCWGIR